MRLVLLIALWTSLCAPGFARAGDVTTNPYPGVQHLHRTSTSPPLDIHALKVDLSYVELSFFVTGSADRGRTVSDFAALYGVDMAWNGDLFAPLGFAPEGLAMGGHTGAVMTWPGTMDTPAEGVVGFARTDRNEVHVFTDIPPGTSTASWVGAVGGRPIILQGGVVPSFPDCSDPEVDPCGYEPRTAIGTGPPLGQAPPRMLVVAVVAGRSALSRGMQLDELGYLMLDLGAADALALDGGSASTLYIRNQMGVVNLLADGVERQVANQVGIKFDPSPVRYTLEGRVAEGDVQTGPAVVGALVTRDDGVTRTTTSQPVGLDNYVFDAPDTIPARYVCISVRKTGYRTAGACKQINPGGGSISYLNVVMERGTDPPDAAPPPDAMRPDGQVRSDASTDAPARSDGGGVGGLDGGGCGCAVGRSESAGTWASAALASALLSLLALGAAKRGAKE